MLKQIYRITLIIFLFLMFGIGMVNASTQIQWSDYETGMKLAEETGKPVMIYFYTNYAETRFDTAVIEAASKFVTIKVNMDVETDLASSYNVLYPPSLVFLNKDKQVIQRLPGNVNEEVLLKYISEAWSKKDDIGETIQTVEEFNIDTISIKELKNFIGQKTSKKIKIRFNLIGTIRDLQGNGNPYYFYLDDGTGSIHVAYIGGLGDITSGDKVKVEGFYASSSASAESISMTAERVLRNDALPKTNGFEAILALVSIFLIATLYMDKKIRL